MGDRNIHNECKYLLKVAHCLGFRVLSIWNNFICKKMKHFYYSEINKTPKAIRFQSHTG